MKSRLPLIRMIVIRRRLLRGQPFNATDVARETETLTKAIHRDIEFMRDFLGYPLGWDARQRSYTGGVPAMPVL